MRRALGSLISNRALNLARYRIRLALPYKALGYRAILDKTPSLLNWEQRARNFRLANNSKIYSKTRSIFHINNSCNSKLTRSRRLNSLPIHCWERRERRAVLHQQRNRRKMVTLALKSWALV